MKPITNEDIDLMYKELSNFEKTQPGIKYGFDFPEFALALVGSKAFEHWVLRSTEEGVFGMLAMAQLKQENPEWAKDPQSHKDEITQAIIEISPFKQIFMKAIYLGYRLGKKGTE